jgi:hypothetical protein
LDRFNRNWTIVLASVLVVGLGLDYGIWLARGGSSPPSSVTPSPSVATTATASPS